MTLIVVKIGLSAILLWIAFRKVDIATALRLVERVSPAASALAVVILTTQQAVASVRFRRLLELLGAKVSFWIAWDAIFIGLFFSQTFISFIGGDAMRVWRIASHQIPVGVAARSILLDRIAGLLGLGIIILLGLPFVFELTSETASRLEISAFVISGMAVTVIFLSLSWLPASFRRWPLMRVFMDVAANMLLILRTPRHMWNILGMSAFIQALNPLIVYVFAKGLGVDVRLMDMFVLVPPVMLLAMLPISFAGWGVREGAMVVGLGLVGISSEQSIATSVCFGLAMIVIALPGGVLWFLRRRRMPSVASPLR